MARINLLPWRQEERLRKNKEFNVVLGAAALVAALGAGMTFMFFNGQLDAQNQANTMIETENARLDKVNEEIATLEQQREEMLARMKLIQDLQGKRSIPVRVWDDIARAIPSAMYLTRMSRADDTITIEGFADNANVVSQLVRNLDASQWLADSRIPMIQSKVEAYQNVAAKPKDKDGQERAVYPEDNYIRFTITTQVKSEQPKEGENAEGTAGATDPNMIAPSDPNAPPPANGQAPAPTDPNATTQQAVVAQPGDAMQPVPVAGQPAPAQPAQAQPAPAQAQPAQAPANAPVQPAPAPTAQPAPAPTAQPVPAPESAQPVPQPAGGK